MQHRSALERPKLTQNHVYLTGKYSDGMGLHRLKKGTPQKMLSQKIFDRPNPYLTCIQVNQTQLNNSPADWSKDASGNYSLNCESN